MKKRTLRCQRCGEVHFLDADEVSTAWEVGCSRCCGGQLEEVFVVCIPDALLWHMTIEMKVGDTIEGKIIQIIEKRYEI